MFKIHVCQDGNAFTNNISVCIKRLSALLLSTVLLSLRLIETIGSMIDVSGSESYSYALWATLQTIYNRELETYSYFVCAAF